MEKRIHAIYELWKTGEFKTKRELAKTLGRGERTIEQTIDAKEFREKKTEAASVSTRAIDDTKGLDDDVSSRPRNFVRRKV